MKQAIKKKSFMKPSVASIKEKLGLSIKTEADLVKSSADKPIEFIQMPEAFSDALKLPGIACGYTTICTGWSNTGKSTIKNCLIASCIRSGILPVLYETENNFDWQFALDCGVPAEPVYGDVEVEDVDPETGEVTGTHVEKRIIDYKSDLLYFDNDILAETYGDNDYSTGKKTKTKRKVAVIEEIAYSMNEILDMQDNGEIQQPICFIWDSVGSISSYKSYASKTGNNMFDAAAISAAFSPLINSRIPASKKVSREFTNTFFCVNKIWNDSMNSMGGAPSIELKGGRTMTFGARLIIHLGGVAKAATKKLSAVAKGETYNYGIVSKIRVTKNQLPMPYNVLYDSEIACVHNGLVSPDRLEEYKKNYMKNILAKLEDMNNGLKIEESDIQFKESEEEGEF